MAENNEKELSIKDIMNYLQGFKEAMKTASDSTNKKIDENSENLQKLDDKMQNFKLNSEEKDKVVIDRFDTMEKRMARIEEGARRMEYQRVKTNKLKQMDKELEKDLTFQPIRRNKPESVEKIPTVYSLSSSYSSNWAQELEATEAARMAENTEHSKRTDQQDTDNTSGKARQAKTISKTGGETKTNQLKTQWIPRGWMPHLQRTNINRRKMV